MSDTIDEVVRDAFLATHSGHSTDDVVICDELNEKFILLCQNRLPDIADKEFNWALMNLRKRGQLGAVATHKERVSYDDFLHASEISARFIYDKYGVNTDRAFCDPQIRREFDNVAMSVAPGIASYLLRKGALRLRKARRLRPELVPRIADWGTRVLDFPSQKVIENPEVIPKKPGIYIFRDTSGYLYIGESHNLYLRVKKHLDHSDRKSLARYFWSKDILSVIIEVHVFDPNSNARFKVHRRAYETSLIQSRHPRFNILL
ncbi:MAG: GIY-YIG nuclease family protein [Sedimentisphaerales bacterium]|jgi:predicted GIY-YIG superfamily endonuclease